MSTAERAILELLDELPKHETFESVDVIMEGLHTLSPHRLQKLLEACSSIKVIRLFFLFAERHAHPWRKQLDETKFRLGSGKRVIATGGRLGRKYQITVPEALHAGD
ncbi:MAG: type IV toxin-antitoxin system AbiEi family antitoxin domain-containing protein [Pseudomonadota bacterium]